MLFPAPASFCCLILAFISILNVESAAQTSLNAELERYRSRYDLPALAAAVVRDGQIIASGAVGTRMAGTWMPVTIDDRFHLGSNTKGLTALLAAILVEGGALRWDSSMAEMFPELASDMNEGFRHVTLQQLLTHLSGLPGDMLPDDPGSAQTEELAVRSFAQEGNLDDLRYWLLGQICMRPLAAPPGTSFAYSNMGYLLAGAILERAGRKTWEQLITERVFQPLALRTAGLGPQATLGHIDAPLGHREVDGKLKAFLAGPNGDVPLSSAPLTAHTCLLSISRAGRGGMPAKGGADLTSCARRC
jgi:CubicO group peptidase (beta-lactamase class C family)